MRDTSIESYNKLKEEGVLGYQESKVYKNIKEMERVTDRTLSLITDLPINSITARRNSLMKKGLVKSLGKVYDPVTKRRVTIWGVVE